MREWLKKLRIEKNMTQAEMGKRLGISESYYCLIENGDRQKNMDITILSKLSVLFGSSFEKLAVMERGDDLNILSSKINSISEQTEERR